MQCLFCEVIKIVNKLEPVQTFTPIHSKANVAVMSGNINVLRSKLRKLLMVCLPVTFHLRSSGGTVFMAKK